MKKYYTLLAILLLCSSCFTLRGLKWWQPDLDDVKKFGSDRIAASPTPFSFIPAGNPKLKSYLDTFLLNTNTDAFVVIRRDSILYEYYKQDPTDLHPSFSVAKSFVGTLVGIAVDKGLIGSTAEPVTKYLANGALSTLTIQQVLDMRAGLAFRENKETPFSEITKLYYGRSLKRQVDRLQLKTTPGGKFEYQSIATQLLAAVLEKATGKKVSALLQEWLWQPLGMQSDALWSVDDRQMVKAFCCLNATALDFAKLGRLYLNKGQWQGQQLLSTEWVSKTTHPDTLFQRGYKNQFWAVAHYRYFKDSLEAVKLATAPIHKNRSGLFYFREHSGEFEAEGILQQIIYVNPKNGVIVVRLGNYPNKNVNFPDGFIPYLGRQL